MLQLRSEHPGLNVLTFVALAGTMAMMAFVAVIGPVVRLLGLAEWHAGLSMTAAGVLWMLAARYWGGLSDRIGRKRVLVIALAAYTVIYTVLALFVDVALQHPPAVIVSVAMLVGARALVGLFYAAVPPAAAAHVADHALPGKRVGAMARLGAANAVGMVVGPMAAGWIALYDLALALYVATLLPLLSLILIGWRLPDSARVSSRHGETPQVGWRDARLRLPIYAAFVAMISVMVTQVTVGFFAIDRLQLSPEEGARVAGMALTAVGIGLIVSQGVMTRIEWLPARWLLLGAGLASVGFGGVAFVQAQWQLLAVYGLAGVGMGLVRPSLQALTADSVEAHEQGAAAGLVASIQGLGMVVAPLTGTLLYRWWPSAPYLLVGGLLLILAFAVVRHRPNRIGGIQ
ncbi:MFS transporter [Chromohalobacter canadensis]|uniref:MFS transporter n=1 Tax=Chromohalobacter canadensis TaxID=141389 RepID=UPI00241058CD|nr:MFS transporter [Chromohalobacter canadensis]